MRMKWYRNAALNFTIPGLACLLFAACSSAGSGSKVAIMTVEHASPTATIAPHSTKPAWEQIEIGKSVNGLPIRATVFGNGKKVILVMGGIHGNEPAGAALAGALERSLRTESISPGLKIIVIPEANPDGLKAGTRQNARNVDLNRNFPSKSWQPAATKDRYQPGPAAASEPETNAFVALLDQYLPALIVSIHAPLNCVNWDGPAEFVAKLLADATGYPLKHDIGYPTPGSLGTFAGIDRKIPTITLELRAQESDTQTEKNVKALEQAFQSMASQ
jgi:protein MpaA